MSLLSKSTSTDVLLQRDKIYWWNLKGRRKFDKMICSSVGGKMLFFIYLTEMKGWYQLNYLYVYWDYMQWKLYFCGIYFRLPLVCFSILHFLLDKTFIFRHILHSSVLLPALYSCLCDMLNFHVLTFVSGWSLTVCFLQGI